MKRAKNFWLVGVLCVMLCGFAFLSGGCGKKKTIEIYQPENIYEIVPGGELQFNVKLENLNEEDVEYAVEAGDATISETGLLTVDTEAEVASIISVFAKAGDVKSNVVNINVVDLKPQAITLTGDNNKIAIGGSVNFDVNYTPAYATIKAYSLAIVGGTGQEYVQLNNKVLTIKSGVNEDDIIGKTVEVKATLTADTTITSTYTVTIVEAGSVESIVASTINYNVAKDANKYMQVSAYNGAGYKLDTDLTDFTFSSSNENIAYVDNNGKISPKGHGKAVITVTAANGKTTTCDVFVMVPPTSMEFNNLSALIVDKKEMSYSKVDALKLNVEFEVGSQYKSCATDVNYDFYLLNDELEVVATGDDVATVSDNGITFKTTGKVKVVVSSNSSLNNNKTSNWEKELELIVNVNEGINIDTVQEFKAYAEQTENIVANVNADLYLTADDNFGANTNNYSTLHLYGDRVINGNGYVLSNSRLPLIKTNDDGNEGGDMLRFDPINLTTPFSLEIYDFSVIGCGSAQGLYNGELAEHASDLVVNTSNGNYIRTYSRGLRIHGGDYEHNETNAYVKKLILSNVEVTGFDAGIRIEHAVDALLTEVRVSNCFGNGIESSQNIMTLNNITIGQVGAFAIELTPDDMAGKDTNAPHGTSGKNYDQTNQITLTGTIDCNNYNNGASTPYMQAFQYAGNDLVDIVDLIGQFAIANTTSNSALQAQLTTLYNQCLKADKDNNGSLESLNLYLLIFVDTTSGDFQKYLDKGNKEGAFAKYYFDSSLGDMINMTDVLKNYADAYNNSQTYEGYKQFKYICVDLDATPLGVGNLGQVILVNEAYDPNYSA